MYHQGVRLAGRVAHNGVGRNADRGLVALPEGNSPLGRLRHRWEDNNKTDTKEVRRESADWIDLAEDKDRRRALVNAVMKLRAP